MKSVAWFPRLVLIVFFAAVTGGPRVFAQTSEKSFSLRLDPSFQEIEVGQATGSARVKVFLTNGSDLTQDIDLFTLDFWQNDLQGGVSLVDKLGTEYRLADYIKLDSDKVQIQPGETKEVGAEIVNDKDLSVGGHYGAIVARFRQQEVGEVQQVLPGVASLLLVRKVGGEQYNLGLSKVSSFGWARLDLPEKVELRFVNHGNVHLIPRGVVEIYDVLGRVVSKGVVNQASTFVLPQNERLLSVKLDKINRGWPVMLYQVKIGGDDSLHKVTYEWHESFLVVSWYVLGLIVLVVGVIAWRLGRRQGEA